MKRFPPPPTRYDPCRTVQAKAVPGPAGRTVAIPPTRYDPCRAVQAKASPRGGAAPIAIPPTRFDPGTRHAGPAAVVQRAAAAGGGGGGSGSGSGAGGKPPPKPHDPYGGAAPGPNKAGGSTKIDTPGGAAAATSQHAKFSSAALIAARRKKAVPHPTPAEILVKDFTPRTTKRYLDAEAGAVIGQDQSDAQGNPLHTDIRDYLAVTASNALVVWLKPRPYQVPLNQEWLKGIADDRKHVKVLGADFIAEAAKLAALGTAQKAYHESEPHGTIAEIRYLLRRGYTWNGVDTLVPPNLPAAAAPAAGATAAAGAAAAGSQKP